MHSLIVTIEHLFYQNLNKSEFFLINIHHIIRTKQMDSMYNKIIYMIYDIYKHCKR